MNVTLRYIFGLNCFVQTKGKPNKRLCPVGQFTCGDLSCISITGRCDRKRDCPYDRADEEGCRRCF